MSLIFTQLGLAQSPPPGTLITSRSVGTYTNGFDNYYPPVSAEVTTEISEGAVLAVSNSVFPTLAQGGETLTYTVIQANTGNTTADDVVLTTTLSEETEFVSATGSGLYDEATHSVSWPVGDLPASAFDSYTVETKVRGDSQRVLNAELIVSTAVISNEALLDSDVATAKLGEGADFAVIKSVNHKLTYPGGILNYGVTVANSGNLDGIDLRIDDKLPDGVTLIEDSVDFPYTLNGQNLEIQVGDIASGTAITAKFAVQVSLAAEDRTVLLNKALARAMDTDLALSNEVSSVVSTDLSLILEGNSEPQAINPGDAIQYTLLASNVGSTIRTDLLVRHPLPAGTEFVAIHNGGSFIEDEAVWEVDALAPDEQLQFTWEVRSHSNIQDNEVLHAPATLENQRSVLASTDVLTLILERASVEVGLYNEDYSEETLIYFEGEDSAYIEVSDSLANQSNDVIDVVKVTVSNGTTPTSTQNASTARSGDVEQVTLTETSASSGLFRGQLQFNLNSEIPGDGSLYVEVNSLLFVSYVDNLLRVTSLQSAAIYNPSTAVFNSVTGEIVPFTTIQVLNEDGSPAQFVDGSSNIFITNFRGEVSIPELLVIENQSIALKIEVSLPPDSGLDFPSVIPDDSLPDELSSGKNTRFGEGSRGEVFTVTSTIPTLAFDVPADPGEGFLRVEKTSRNSQIAIGEIITYEITISNEGSTPVTDVLLIDEPPNEFRYIEGSTVLEDDAFYDAAISSSSLDWRLDRLNPGESIELSYQMMVGIDATEGVYLNSAYASGVNFIETIESNVARHEIRVSEGIFSRNGTVLGRVFVDLNDNGVLDNEEPGIAQTVVLMEDGSYVTTDNMGRFSFRNIRPGQHVLRLDSSSLPLEVEASGKNGRFLNRVDSQWFEMNASGLFKANFPVVPVSDVAREQILAAQQQVQQKTDYTSANETENDIDSALSGLDARAAALQELANNFDSNEFAIVNLQDGQQLPGVHADIQIKFQSAAIIELLLNGEPVDSSHLGTSIENATTGVTLHEYVAVRLTENIENTITAILTDPFGNERGREEIHLFTQSQEEEIFFEIDESISPIADGMTLIPARATVLNSLGNPARQIEMISIDVRPARLIEEDADPANPGHQLRLIDGVAQFSVRAPRQPGESIITVQANEVRGTTSILFQPHLRGLMIVGSGDVLLGSGTTNGGIEQLDNIFGDKVEDGTTADGHLALFVNGAISEKTLLTATYDSAKQRPNDFFFAREQQVDEESMPAITGDGSTIGYSGSSRDKLYLRLDRENSHAVWGDYRTQVGDSQLSAYNRTFTGFRSEILEEKYRVTAFAAEMLQDQIIDAIPANGTSGYYFLSRGPLILGSERVVLETRDRLRPDVVLNSVPLVRNTDYDIDYYEGSILTRSPIPTYDEALNPNILIVTYEVENETNDQWAYGARGEVDLFDGLTLGATAVVEESAIDDYGLQGIDLSWHMDEIGTLFTAQYAQSQSVVSEDGLLNSEDGSGLRFNLEGSPRENIEYSAYYQNIDEFFVNPSAVDMRPGTKIFGADGSYTLSETSSLNIAAFKEEDELNDNNFSHVAAGWQGEVNRFTLGAELYSDQFDSDRVAPSSLADDGRSANEAFDSATGRYPFDSTAEQVSQDIGLRLSGSTNITDKLAMTLSHGQDMENTDQSLTYAKFNYDLSEDRSLYFIQRYDRYEDRDEARSLFGLETPIAYNTTSFVEYQMEDTANGNQIRQSIGLRNLFQLGENFFGNASYENLDTISGEAGANRPDGFASTVSTTYLATEKLRLTGRAEYRDETEMVTKLGEFGVATELSEDFTLLGRARYFTTEGEKSGAREDLRTTLGLAWRPTNNDRFQGLARLDWWNQDRETEHSTFAEDKLYGSVEGIYQLTNKLSISAKYAGKQYELDSYSLYNDLYSVRATYLLNDRWELGATARVLNEHDFDNTLTGGAVDVGFRVWEFIWLTVGYSFDDFDSDLTAAGYSGQGVFAKFRFKFDENILSDF